MHGVIGKDEREDDNPSYFNSSEILLVKYYVDALIDQKKATGAEIGVIAPYRKQVYMIKNTIYLFLHKISIKVL